MPPSRPRPNGSPKGPCRVIAVVNQKGGVGKTTTAVNLAASVAAAEKKTLLLDLDPQGNASSGVGIRPRTVERSVYDCLIGRATLREVIAPTDIAWLFVAPATQDLVAAELELVDDPDRAIRMKNALAALMEEDPYEYVFIDCPPSLGILTVNALTAADRVLVPLQCEYYALEGLTHLMATIDRVKNGTNPALEVEGIVLTMFDARNNLAHQVADEVRAHFRVFESVIPRNVRLSEAPSHGKPALLYDAQSRGAQAYLALAHEFLAGETGKRGASGKSAAGEILTTVSDASQGNKKRALGRGLDALLPTTRPMVATADGSRVYFQCAIEKLTAQKGQPRRHFDPKALEELSQSISDHGVLEPIVVRKAGEGRFEIIAGERRFRASQKAGLHEVPVIVKDASPTEVFELALIENVQREDLNAVELAEALDRLVKEHSYTQETLATRLGKDRSTISNSLRLLKLPVRVRDKVMTGELSEGHARSLLGAPEGAIEGLAEKVIRGKLSVRATEALVRGAKTKTSGTAKPAAKSSAVRDLETRLTRALGTAVFVRDKGNQGEVAIPYADLDALDRLIDKLM